MHIHSFYISPTKEMEKKRKSRFHGDRQSVCGSEREKREVRDGERRGDVVNCPFYDQAQKERKKERITKGIGKSLGLQRGAFQKKRRCVGGGVQGVCVCVCVAQKR